MAHKGGAIFSLATNANTKGGQAMFFLFFPKVKPNFFAKVHAFVTSRVDHCNGLLYGSYSYFLDRLQSMLNSATRLVLNIAKSSEISTAICDELHWLPIRKRIELKIGRLVRHCLVSAAQEYLLDRTVSSCQFGRRLTKPPVCFQRRPHHSSFPTPNIWFPSFCYLGPSALELTPIGR